MRRPVLGACALAALLSTLLLMNSAKAEPTDAGSQSVFSGSTDVPALNQTGWSIKTDMNMMSEPAITGHLTASGGLGNDIQVLVLSETDYANWNNGHTVTPLYNSGQVTAADVNARLPESGTYYVVLSNKFSTFTPKTVTGDLRMTWQPGPAVIAARQATRDSVMRNAIVLVVASAALGACVVAMVTQRKKKAPEAEKVKAAA